MTLSVPDKMLRIRDVVDITALKRSAIYKAVAEGRFPKPIFLAPGTRAVGWLASEIAAHQKRCVAERDRPARNASKRKRGRA
jgi:prophage regulatory protein